MLNRVGGQLGEIISFQVAHWKITQLEYMKKVETSDGSPAALEKLYSEHESKMQESQPGYFMMHGAHVPSAETLNESEKAFVMKRYGGGMTGTRISWWRI